MNPMLSMMMNRLRNINPQGYQTVNSMMQSGGNPKQLLQQMVGNADNNQMQHVLQQGRSMGIPDNILSQLQNMKK
jgi:hypothetical protein